MSLIIFALNLSKWKFQYLFKSPAFVIILVNVLKYSKWIPLMFICNIGQNKNKVSLHVFLLEMLLARSRQLIRDRWKRLAFTDLDIVINMYQLQGTMTFTVTWSCELFMSYYYGVVVSVASHLGWQGLKMSTYNCISVLLIPISLSYLPFPLPLPLLP